MKKHSSLAFTMLEVMIAMALLSLILTAVYSSWTAILRGSKVGMDEAARVQRARMSMRAIVDALLGVQMYAASPAYYSFVTDTKSDFAYLSFASHLPSSFPDAGLYGDLAMRRVTFAIEPGTNTPAQLVMYQLPILMDSSPEQQPLPVVLARDVKVFALEFWDTRLNKWADQWKATNQLPKRIRVTLGTGKANSYQIKPEELIIREVSIPSMVVPREYQLAPAGPGAQPLPGQPGFQPMPGQPGISGPGGQPYVNQPPNMQPGLPVPNNMMPAPRIGGR